MHSAVGRDVSSSVNIQISGEAKENRDPTAERSWVGWGKDEAALPMGP